MSSPQLRPRIRAHDPARGSPARYSTRAGWIGLVGLVAAYLSWQLLHWLPFNRQLTGDSLLLLINLFAFGAAMLAARRAGGARRLRRAWLWVALALLGQAAGAVAQIVYEAAGVEAYPSLADPLYLSFYPLLFVGVLSFPSGRRRAGQALELALDSAIVSLGGGLVFVYFILGPSAIAARTPLETITSVAYPLGDMILLLALCSALLRGTMKSTRSSLRLMAAAIAGFAVADLIYGYIVLHGVYHGGDPIETLYAVAFACFAAAALSQRKVVADEPAAESARVGARASWLPYLAIVAGLAVMLARDYSRPFFPDLSIGVILAMTVTLVMVRQMLSQVTLSRSRERLAQAQEIAQIGTWEWDLAGGGRGGAHRDRSTLSVDTRELRMSRSEALGLIHPDDRERLARTVGAAVRNHEQFMCEVRVVRPDGEIRTMLMRGQAEVRAGQVRCVRGSHQDITDRKRMEIQLKYQADHDPLTGLFNRRRFAEELERTLREASRYGRRGALLMLDLDDFKVLNDTRGHAAGDAALRALAQTILARVRSTDVVARLGGDEFAIVLPGADVEHARAVAEDIRVGVGALEEPMHITVGLVPFDDHWDLPAGDPLIAADIALYEAKEQGKNQVGIYRGTAGSAVTWVERIRTALREDRFVLHAQPILDLRSGEVSHSELLIRMVSDTGEVIAPGSFLPSAERFGLIRDIDRWVTSQGLALARSGERVSINLSAQSVGDAGILAAVRGAMSEGIAPGAVIFEITESTAMRNIDEARAFTEALVALGCQVALDDFGTGFASFTHLKHLPVSFLKIDMEFVRDIVENAADREIVDSITRIAHSLGMETIAEGVEDAGTMRVLRDYGVDRAQGFFVGRPAPVARAAVTGADAAGRGRARPVRALAAGTSHRALAKA